MHDDKSARTPADPGVARCPPDGPGPYNPGVRKDDPAASSADGTTESHGDPTSAAGGPDTALPPLFARVLAFLAVFVGAAAGGFIGYAFAELGNFEGFTGGLIVLLTGLGFAGGVAVIAVLTLRALGEWRTIREQGPDAMRAARTAQTRRVS